jgi:hypothetical protein
MYMKTIYNLTIFYCNILNIAFSIKIIYKPRNSMKDTVFINLVTMDIFHIYDSHIYYGY